MFATQEITQDLEAIRVIAILATVAVMVFWRIVIKLILITLMALATGLVVFGIFAFIIGMHG